LDTSAITITPMGDRLEFALKVVPGASRTRIAGVLGNALKVAVSAAPEGGKANAAVIELLASALKLKKADLEIVSGHTQPRKRVAVRGVTEQVLRARLGQVTQ
jgi:uncharacterized protein